MKARTPKNTTLPCAFTSQVVCGLQVQPRARIAAKVARQPHGGIGADAAPLANDVVDARRRHVQGLGSEPGFRSSGSTSYNPRVESLPDPA
jgi:hypothetical protein